MSSIEKVKEAAAKTQVVDVRTLIQTSVKELAKALPSHMNAERMVRIALTTLRMNPKLYDCEPMSFLGALFQSAQLGLEPNIEGQAYIIPYRNNKKKPDGTWHSVMEASFQIGYKGYVELFFRHQSAVSLDMQEVRENDEFAYEYGTESYLKHKPALKDRGEVIGYYAVAKLANGAKVFKFMGKEECIEHGKKHTKCVDKQGNFYADTPWQSDPDAMGKKTVLIQLMKLLPKSIEIQKALAMDNTIKSTVAADMIAIPDEIVWDKEKSLELDAQILAEENHKGEKNEK